MKKCPDCLLCLDVIWIVPRRIFRCYLCEKMYDILDGKLVEIDPITLQEKKDVEVEKEQG